MGVAFAVVPCAAVFGQSRPVFLDATLVDRDGRTVSILPEVPDHWNFRHLRAARILLLHGLISGLGGHFILRKSLLRFADGVFCTGAGDGARCDCIAIPQPRSGFSMACCCFKPFHPVESGTYLPVGSAPDSSARAGILERCGAESISCGATTNRGPIAILSFSAERCAASDRAARY